MIEIRQLSHDFDGRPVLREISLTLSEHRIGIIGSNGSGKSTLARTLNALVHPKHGEILIDGISARQDAAKVRRLVGYVFQNPEHQIVMPTLEEDLAFGLWNLNLPKDHIMTKVNTMLAHHGLESKRTWPAHLLSGGEQKLLTLISVLVMEPRYIVFDEPLNSLDLAARRHLIRVMDALEQTVITITHDFDLIAGYDRAILIHEGRVAADGAPGEVVAEYMRMVDAAGARS
jgi:biotin transport system ATP-binding protein